MKLPGTLDKLSPNQLALVSTLGNLAIAFCMVGPSFRLLRTHQHVVPTLCVTFGAILLFIVCALWAENRLKNGIQNQRWPEVQLTLLRRFSDTPVIGYVIGLTLLLCIVYAVYRICNHRLDTHVVLTPPYWAGWLLAIYASRMRNLFAADLPSSTYYRHRPITPTDFKPIHSDNWGERGSH